MDVSHTYNAKTQQTAIIAWDVPSSVSVTDYPQVSAARCWQLA